MVEGLYVTGIGMGVVFAFLCILVLAITLTDMLVAKYEKANPPAEIANKPKAKKSIPEEEVIAVAIASAIKHGELV